MGQLADGACEAGGKVIGIMPERLMKPDVINERCDELIVTATCGTQGPAGGTRRRFDRPAGRDRDPRGMVRVVVGRTLGYHDKPLVLLNVNGYYDPLLAMMEHGIEQRFIKPECRELFFVAESVDRPLDI